jgi:hypothetical protein
MQTISALELRKDLAWACTQVKNWKTLVMQVHWVETMWLVDPEWAYFVEKIGEIDMFLSSLSVWAELAMRKIVIWVLNSYALSLTNTKNKMKFNELLQSVTNDLHTILMGERKKMELNIN